MITKDTTFGSIEIKFLNQVLKVHKNLL